ncbi:MAG TPA: Na+/H+ antiporter NhaA [Candidatus Dormibacteraeota bacterium]|nr:Na+/H+ antiporter NhaA [Candidatus Dormibacteraeota bacterium]
MDLPPSTVEGPFSPRTAGRRGLRTPLRSLLRIETGSVIALLGATAAALVWANVDASSYARVWSTTLAINLGDHGIAHGLGWWVNSGLMAFFFFVVGLEARQEFDMGELRDRRRLALPLGAGLGGMAVPILIYLAINAAHGAPKGWGMAMSTDTAFALGLLTLVAGRLPERLRIFLLTISIVDDTVGLAVIATVYTGSLDVVALAAAAGLFVAMIVALRAGIARGAVYVVFGTAAWVALSESGVDPVVVGLGMGLLTYASATSRGDLERASDLFRRYREQPTPRLARSARIGLESTLSPNERLQHLYSPLTNYAVVPLFALANAGFPIDPPFLGRAFSSPITLGVLVGYVVGKPIGVLGGTWLVTTLSRGRIRPAIGWAGVLGDGAIAGVGLTVPLLIASLAFQGEQLDEARLGVLSAALGACLTSGLVFRVVALLPPRARARALISTAEAIVDLAVPVDPERDHMRGPDDAQVTLVEYGDFECPYCGRAEEVVRELLRDSGDLRYVWRHLPLTDVHPRAQSAAEAAESAAAQGAFWEMYDALMDHQDALAPADLLRYAEEIDLDVVRFAADLRARVGAQHVAEDVDSADLGEVSGTPTFFINGQRHRGAYDVETLSRAVRIASARAAMSGEGS